MTDEPAADGGGDRPARQRILEAAETLFARDGFDRTPVSRIATLAGVPHGLVFYYFQTKIGLLLALIRDYSSTLVPALDDSPGDDPGGLHDSGASAPDSAFVLVRNVLEAINRHTGTRETFRRIVFQEMAAHPEVRRQAQALHDAAADAVSGRLRRGMAEIGHPVDPGAATAAARMLLAVTLLARLTYEQEDPRVRPEDLVAIVARGLVGIAGH